MSLDVELFHLVSPAVDFPTVFVTAQLGEAELVRQAIEGALPTVQWVGDRGYIEKPAGTHAEITLWRDGAGVVEFGSVDRITLSIRGEGDPMTIIAPLCDVHGWSACDSTLTLLDSEDAKAEAPFQLTHGSRPIWRLGPRTGTI